jgi:TatD DNase family protein
VAALAGRFPDLVRPSFGYHPWYVTERTPVWREALVRFLDQHPGAAIGEIGLDRWKPGLDLPAQEEVFTWQLRLAAERGLPASIHCLQAWGRLFDLLRAGSRPNRGFLLHSYGGPEEMVAPLARLGAYFSLPGYFAHERKHRQRAAFKAVPCDRLLIETDAPDQCLPAGGAVEGLLTKAGAGLERHPLRDPQTGKAINHPANLRAVYEFAADLYGEPVASLAERVEANFVRLFGPAG